MAPPTAHTDVMPTADGEYSPMARLVIGTLLIGFAEWLMLELLRTPYRPPADMLTLLGTEKYGLVAIMTCVAFAWFVYSLVILTRTRLTITRYLVLTAVIVMVTACFGYIVVHPHRAVTPWHVLWS